MTKTALVIGCGGTIGGAWAIAALDELTRQTGWNPMEASVLQGTSAGAEMVTMLAGGFAPSDLADMQSGRPTSPVLEEHLAATPPSLPKLPGLQSITPSTLWTRSGGHAPLTGIAPRGRGDSRWLQRLADRVDTDGDGWLPHPGARLVAYRVDDGARIAFGAPAAPRTTVGEALRASWAIPGWMPPVRIDGRTYVDGGAASTASVDLVGPEDADLVYLITPMASPSGVRAPGLGGRAERALLRAPMSKVLDAEIDRVRRRGTRVVHIAPTDLDMAGLGPNFMNRNRRAQAFDAARRTVVETVGRALDAEATR
ncbi:patatin-like phospholipase family protein [Gordonia neofelifaecis]|uniref:Patatin n=1 Tax=Gordonia neofelifaecis NRRL B-59395 TaxID=644548 RepID=F1YHF4_9ACTN|nr:patatin-like phospholipase family protein [Gordonia neofelifaecis]EGD55792.1 Patatin [Gordonia neofelifaecis NRRL B-59395]